MGIQTHTSINLININKSRLLLDKDNREERLLEMNGNEWQWPYIHLTARENVTEIEDPLERVFFENDSEVSSLMNVLGIQFRILKSLKFSIS